MSERYKNPSLARRGKILSQNVSAHTPNVNRPPFPVDYAHPAPRGVPPFQPAQFARAFLPVAVAVLIGVAAGYTLAALL